MGIPLRVIDPPEDIFAVQVGDMWRKPELDVPDREAWYVVLPSRTGRNWPNLWYTTETALGQDHPMWDVSGTPPKITVSPSIKIMSHDGDEWHGYIRDGELVEA